MTTEQRVSRWIKTHGYGLSEQTGRNLVELHKKGTDDDKRFVEALFTDLNYHTECKLLKQEDYVAAHHLWETD